MDRTRCERSCVAATGVQTWPWSMGTMGLPRAEEYVSQILLLAVEEDSQR